MQETRRTIRCDRCKHEAMYLTTEDAPFVLYRINLTIYSLNGRGRDDNAERTAEWCEDCCIKTGLRKPYVPSTSTENVVKPQDPLPTLEDMVREIVQDEIATCGG